MTSFKKALRKIVIMKNNKNNAKTYNQNRTRRKPHSTFVGRSPMCILCMAILSFMLTIADVTGPNSSESYLRIGDLIALTKNSWEEAPLPWKCEGEPLGAQKTM